MNCATFTTEALHPSPSISAEFAAFPDKDLGAAPKLSVDDAISLFGALETIESVIHALSMRPSFSTDYNNDGFNDAGIELDDMRIRISRRMNALVAIVRAGSPTKDGEWNRNNFLVRYDIENDPSLLKAAKEAIRAKRPDLI